MRVGGGIEDPIRSMPDPLKMMEKEIADKIEKILREFGSGCYWYGEDTGDYNMKQDLFSDEVFFLDAMKAILDLIYKKCTRKS